MKKKDIPAFIAHFLCLIFSIVALLSLVIIFSIENEIFLIALSIMAFSVPISFFMFMVIGFIKYRKE